MQRLRPPAGHTPCARAPRPPLTDAVGGGTWVSGTTTVATVGISSGIVTGIAIGTTVVTYTAPAAAPSMTRVTVSLAPTAIVGTTPVCIGTGYLYTDAVSGGLWMSSNISVATIGSTGGILTGVATGTAVITYSLGSGCVVYKTATVISLACGHQRHHGYLRGGHHGAYGRHHGRRLGQQQHGRGHGKHGRGGLRRVGRHHGGHLFDAFGLHGRHHGDVSPTPAAITGLAAYARAPPLH